MYHLVHSLCQVACFCLGVNCKRVLVTVTVTVGSKLVDWIPAIPHSGQLNSSNSTCMRWTKVLSSKPISNNVLPLLFTVKSPAAQLFTPTREGGSVGTLLIEWFPSRQTPIPQNIGAPSSGIWPIYWLQSRRWISVSTGLNQSYSAIKEWSIQSLGKQWSVNTI